MINMKYALEKGGPKRLEILWDVKHTEFHIKLDDKELAVFDNPEPLLAGQEFTLEDGSRLKIQLPGRSKFASFVITRDGRLLSPKTSLPAERLKSTCQILYIIAAVNIMGGLSGLMPSSRIKLISQYAWLLIIIGLIVLILALFVKRRSKTALTIVTSVFALDTITFLFYTGLPMWGRILVFILRVVLLLGLLMGFGAINELNHVHNDSDKNL